MSSTWRSCLDYPLTQRAVTNRSGGRHHAGGARRPPAGGAFPRWAVLLAAARPYSGPAAGTAQKRRFCRRRSAAMPQEQARIAAVTRAGSVEGRIAGRDRLWSEAALGRCRSCGWPAATGGAPIGRRCVPCQVAGRLCPVRSRHAARCRDTMRRVSPGCALSSCVPGPVEYLYSCLGAVDRGE